MYLTIYSALVVKLNISSFAKMNTTYNGNSAALKKATALTKTNNELLLITN